MRTTLTLDDDVSALLEREMKRRNASLKAVVNEALRQGLYATPMAGKSRRRYRTRPWDLGKPKIRIECVWDAIAWAEGEDYR